MSFEPLFTNSAPITEAIARIERARGFLEGLRLSEARLRALGERALLSEAHFSTHIEGTRLTLDQSARLWAGQEVADADPEDVRELLNYRRAFDLVARYLDERGPITETLIREIHRQLVEGVRGDAASPGAYRRVQNFVVNSKTGAVLYTPPDPVAVPALMAELVTWINGSDLHPVIASGIAQFQLVHIHPFVDGNGRSSRLLSTLVLYRAGYDFKRLFSISEYYDRDRPAFYRAIQGVRDRGMDLTGWLEYFSEGLATQLAEVGTGIQRSFDLDRQARDHGLNARQAWAVARAYEPGGLSIRALEERFGDVSRRTLQRDLKGLVDLGLLESQGAGPTDPNRRYGPAEASATDSELP
jgi:Fic family protein